MTKIKKILTQVIALAVIFMLFSSNLANAYPENPDAPQRVFFSEIPMHELVAGIKREHPDWDPGHIANHLRNTLRSLTPRLARDQFNIKWLDNTLTTRNVGDILIANLLKSVSKAERGKLASDLRARLESHGALSGHYPDVVVCYLGEGLGYGLFLLEPEGIKENKIIAEYTGRRLPKANPNSKYFVPLPDDRSGSVVDAEKGGNTARFAMHFFTGETLRSLGFLVDGMPALDSPVGVATANTHLLTLAGEGLTGKGITCLMTTRNINPLEQIGFEYVADFGFPEATFDMDPVLFDRTGQPIDQARVTLRQSMLRITDETTDDVNGNMVLLGVSELASSGASLTTSTGGLKLYGNGEPMICLPTDAVDKVMRSAALRQSIRGCIIKRKLDITDIIDFSAGAPQNCCGFLSAIFGYGPPIEHTFADLNDAQQAEMRAFLDHVTEGYMQALRFVDPNQQNPNGEVLWGGDVELIMIANLLTLRIIVHEPSDDQTTVHPAIGPADGIEVHLWYKNGHYENYDQRTREHTNDVPRDGNCMFHAMLRAYHLARGEHGEYQFDIRAVEMLRRQVADRIGEATRGANNDNNPIYVRFAALFRAQTTRQLIDAIADLPHGDLLGRALRIIGDRLVVTPTTPKKGGSIASIAASKSKTTVSARLAAELAKFLLFYNVKTRASVAASRFDASGAGPA